MPAASKNLNFLSVPGRNDLIACKFANAVAPRAVTSVSPQRLRSIASSVEYFVRVIVHGNPATTEQIADTSRHARAATTNVLAQPDSVKSLPKSTANTARVRVTSAPALVNVFDERSLTESRRAC